MKIYLIILLFACFLLISILVYLYFLIRYKLYKDLVYICKYLKNNISFNKDDISTLLELSYEHISPTSKTMLNAESFKFFKVLKREDKININNFFNSLGKGDVDFEINNITYYENNFVEFERTTKEDLTKRGLMYFKLIIGIGLIVCILIL